MRRPGGLLAFTWANPRFATLKASYLLGLAVPIAFYGSEVLASWTRGGGARRALLKGARTNARKRLG